jgi:Zn-dependent protease
MAARPHFSVAGVPVRVEPFFLVVAVLFGMRYEQLDLIAVWVAVMFVSVLVHELGHAFALKLFGVPSAIVLHGFGGVTVSQGRHRSSRGRSIFVSVAGSAAALLLLWLPTRTLVGSEWFWDQHLLVRAALVFTAFANLWWSIANLLPIRPLDGGHVASEIIGVHRARVLSIVICGVAALWVFTQHQEQSIAGFFAVMLGFLNWSEIRAERQGARGSAFAVEPPAGSAGRSAGARGGRRGLQSVPPPRPERPGPTPEPPVGGDAARVEAAAWAALTSDQPDRARSLLGQLRQAPSVSPFLPAAVALAGGSTELALELYERAWLAQPQGPPQLVATSLVGRNGVAVPLAERLVADPGGLEAASTLQTHLHYAGSFAAAARAGEIVARAGAPSPAQTAFETACSWARAGEVDRAIDWLERAGDDGFRALALVDGEPDLASVRSDPRWPVVRAKLI